MKPSNTAMCKRCLMGTVLTGEQRQYNAKSIDGQVICTDCKIAEVYEQLQNR